MQLSAAERLLQELGVTEPKEIDLEAIAYHLGAYVKYRPLDGCEARIVGCNGSAIITVNEHSSAQRKRFSIAHELGHWCYDRGKQLVCRTEEMKPRDQLSPERIADGYAADLMMPHYLFRPVARRHAKLTFKTVDAVAEVFNTSRTATAIRLVEGDHSPALLVCHGSQGRKWFARAPSVPNRWFPTTTLDEEGFAFGVLRGEKRDDAMPHKIGADAWFDCANAANYEVHEQTVRTAADEVLTLVLLSDEMLDN